MKNRRALFFTVTNILSDVGNGGVKASREHYELIKRIFGEQHTYMIMYVPKEEIITAQQKTCEREYVFEKLSGSSNLLLAALFGCRIYFPWKEKELFSLIRGIEPDIVFVDFSINGRLIKRLSGFHTIVFFHNVEADYTFNKVKNDGFFYLPAYYAAKKNDIWASKADMVLCFNERDSNRLWQLYGRRADYIIPVALKDRFIQERCKKTNAKRLLFLGSRFGPNEEGIDWFIKTVMSKLPDITLDIVGIGFENKRNEYSEYRNVNVIGSVKNTDEYYYSHSAVVMPIRYGAGMKVKTAEAMMFGKTIFASDEALEGYNVEGVEGIYRCNTSYEFERDIHNWFAQERDSYEVDVRKLFKENFDSEANIKLFESCMLECLKK